MRTSRSSAAGAQSPPAKELKPYVDTISSAALLDPIPEPGSIGQTSTRDAIGITEWELFQWCAGGAQAYDV